MHGMQSSVCPLCGDLVEWPEVEYVDALCASELFTERMAAIATATHRAWMERVEAALTGHLDQRHPGWSYDELVAVVARDRYAGALAVLG